MNIVKRFEKLIPNSKCYWDGNINQLSIHLINNPKGKEEIEITVVNELDKIGLLRAVKTLRILSY